MSDTKEESKGSVVIESCIQTDAGKKDAVNKQNGKRNKTAKPTAQQRQKAIPKHDCSVAPNVKPVLPSISNLSNTIQRQSTFTLYGCNRKSRSQVDLKQALRDSPRRINNEIESKSEAIVIANHPCIAGLRIYNEVLLNSWRKRGHIIKDLTLQVERLKQNAANTKNQLHVYKTLFADEKERTKELSEQLSEANQLIASLQQSEADLKSQLANSEKKRINAEQQLLMKTQDHHAVNVYFKQTKNELYKLMSDNQETQLQLKSAQQIIHDLETERSKLLKSIELISKDACDEEEQLRHDLKLKTDELAEMTLKFQNTKAELQKVKEKFCFELNKFNTEESKLKKELEASHTEAEILRHCLAGTVGQRMQNCWNTTMMMQRTTFGFVHWFAAAVLPAFPPPVVGAPGIPTMPLGTLTLEKAINMIKR